MNRERGFRRVVITISFALVCGGLGLTAYESYRAFQYVSASRQHASAQKQAEECLREIHGQEHAAVQMARGWMLKRGLDLQDLSRLYHREIEDAVREREDAVRERLMLDPVFRNATKDLQNAIVAKQNAGRPELATRKHLQEFLERRDADFGRAAHHVQRLIVSALLEARQRGFTDTWDEEDLPRPDPGKSNDKRRLKHSTIWAFWNETSECLSIAEGYKFPVIDESGRLLAYLAPLAWGRGSLLGDPASGDSWKMVLLPMILGLVLSAGAGAVPWGAFYLCRWIARGFGGEP